jgi:hypothetical protein
MDQSKKQIDSNETIPAFRKKLTIRDLEQVSGGRMSELKTKVSDGGYTSEGEG